MTSQELVRLRFSERPASTREGGVAQNRAGASIVAGCLVATSLLAGCGGRSAGSGALGAEVPLHLEEHLDAATIDGSHVPDTVGEVVEWRFDEPQPGWRPIAAKGARAVEPVRIEDGLRIPLTSDSPSFLNSERLEGYLYVALPKWRLEDWSHIEVQARASKGMRNFGLLFNYSEDVPEDYDVPFISGGVDRAGLVSDETVQTYRISLDPRRPWEGPWTHLGLWFNAVAEEGARALSSCSRFA